MAGKIIAVCSAPAKGMIKHDQGEGVLIVGKGLEGDGHFGFAHRQVSLISIEDIRIMMAKLPNLRPGSFAENLTTEGFDLGKLHIGENTKEMLTCDLKLELSALTDLKAAIAYCETVGDSGSRELLEDILESEEEHIDWLETQLGLIEKVGLENYLQSQMDE